MQRMFFFFGIFIQKVVKFFWIEYEEILSFFYLNEFEFGKVKVILLKEVIYQFFNFLLYKDMDINCELIIKVFDFQNINIFKNNNKFFYIKIQKRIIINYFEIIF